MPIYEFLCEKCKRFFEKFFFKPSDTDDVNCPHCGSNEVKKQMSNVSKCGCSSDSGSESFTSSSSCGVRRFG